MINCSSYFFEETKRGFFQYPHDYAEGLFKSYRDNFSADAQIVAHRQANLMYYTYIKRLYDSSGEPFFGISVVLNGLETVKIKSLFKLFEKIFQQIVFEGEILTMNTEGQIVAKNIEFSAFVNTFNRLATDIKNYIEDGISYFSTMSPVVYSATEDDYATISYNENENAIRQHLKLYNKLFIIKNNRTTSAELNGIAVKIRNLSEQIEYLRKRNAELESKNGGKRYIGWKSLAISCLTAIIVLSICLIYFIACGLISFNL